jgi:hypothetical protein
MDKRARELDVLPPKVCSNKQQYFIAVKNPSLSAGDVSGPSQFLTSP